LAGALASRIGVTATMFLGGSLCFAGSLVFARNLRSLREHIIPVYRQKGIIPEVATGIQTATELAVPPEEQ
jgi:hypothetical protein